MDKKYENDDANDGGTNGDTIFVEPARGYSAPSYTIPSLTYWNPILRSRANKLIAKRRTMVETYTTPLLQPSSLSSSASASASASASETTDGNGNCGGVGVGGVQRSTDDYADRVAGTDGDDDDVDFTTASSVFSSDSETAREMRMFLNEFYKTIYTDERQEHYRRVRERLPEVNQHYVSLVKNDATMMPIITMEQFWERYEWRVGDGSVGRVMKEIERNDKKEKAKRTKVREEEKYAQEQKHRAAMRLAEQKREEERLKRLERAVEEQRARMDMESNDTTGADNNKKKREKDHTTIEHDGDDPSQKILSAPGPAPQSSSNNVFMGNEQSKKKKNVIHDMFRQDEQRKRREAKELQVGLARFAQNFHAFTGALTSDDNLQNGTNILEKKLEHITDETIRKNDDDTNRRQQRESTNNDDDGPNADAGTNGGNSIDPIVSSSQVEENQESAIHSSSTKKLTSTTVLLVLWAATSVLWLGPVIRFAQNPNLAVVTMAATPYNMLCGPVRPGWYLDINQIESNWWKYNGNYCVKQPVIIGVWKRRCTSPVKDTTVLFNSPWWSGEGLVKELATVLSNIPWLWFFASSSVDDDEGFAQTTSTFGDTVCSRLLKSLEGRVDVHGLLPPDQQSHLQFTILQNCNLGFPTVTEIQIFVDKEEKSSSWMSSKKKAKKKNTKREIQYKRSSVLQIKPGGGLKEINVSWDGMYIIETRWTFDVNKCRESDYCTEQAPWSGFVESRTKFVAPWAVDTTKLFPEGTQQSINLT